MNRMSWLVVLTAGVFLLGCAKDVDRAVEGPDMLWIADFDAGQEPNLLGGGFGAWDRDPEDETQSSETFFCEDIRVGETGYSLGIKYDVDSPNPAFNGMWMKLDEVDLSPYESLNFSIRGDAEEGFTERMKMELKNADGQTGTYMLSGITDQWQEIQIPLRAFRGLRDLSRMDELIIVFEDTVSSPKEGVVHIDNIYVQ